MQRRELKWMRSLAKSPKKELPLMQRRELKYGCALWQDILVFVASHAEAWIEICRGWLHWQKALLPLMQRRELKCQQRAEAAVARNCCLSCRGVNWNSVNLCIQRIFYLLPLMQRRELKFLVYFILRRLIVASHAEAWIEIKTGKGEMKAPLVASHAEAWIEILTLVCLWKFLPLPLMQRRELKLAVP